MLPPEFITPNYTDGSIANVPATIAKWLDIPFEGLPPLADEMWKSADGDINHVIIFVIDALGWSILQEIGETLPAWGSATIRSPITSVFPSTTVNALSSIHTGTPPAQHGLVGLRLFFPEFGTIGQMINLSPSFISYPTALEQAGLDTENFLATESVGSKFAEYGVETHLFKNREIVNSGLSKILGSADAEEHGAISVADMFVKITDLVKKQPYKKLYINCYWDTIDTLSHRRGPQSDSVFAEVQTLFFQLQTQLLAQLPADGKTVVAVMSDHGQSYRPTSHHVYLRDHPQLEKMLLMRPASDPTVPFLYAKQGQVQNVIDYINSELHERAFALESADALQLGLLGSPPYAPQTIDRLGDVVVLMKEGALFGGIGDERKLNRFRGSHGSLTRAEMEASWLVWKV